MNARDDDQRMPLYFAAWKGHKAVCRLLVVQGAALDVRDDQDRTPIGSAQFRGYTDLAGQLQRWAELRTEAGGYDGAICWVSCFLGTIARPFYWFTSINESLCY